MIVPPITPAIRRGLRAIIGLADAEAAAGDRGTFHPSNGGSGTANVEHALAWLREVLYPPRRGKPSAADIQLAKAFLEADATACLDSRADRQRRAALLRVAQWL